MQGFKHVVHTVHALLPTELLILAILVALHRVEHSAYDGPSVCGLVVGHSTCGVAPCATSVLVKFSVITSVDGCPVVVIHAILGNLGTSLINFHKLANCGGFRHLAGAVVLDESSFRTAELTNHIEGTGDEC